MRKLLVLMIVFALFFMVSCTGMKIKYDYDQMENFSEYRSFDFLKIPATVTVDPMVITP